MKTFNVITIFPDMFASPFSLGVVSKGIEAGLIGVNPVDLRDYAPDRHRTTDDYQYGGGQGLVMKPEPIISAVRDVREKQPNTRVILLDPRGTPFNQDQAERLATYDSVTFICGRYEGVDERVRELVVDEEMSLGDFVLTGGEFAAMVMIDAAARLVPGVLGDEQSCVDESFTMGLLEYPHYTRPAEVEGLGVPEVLTSGHHAEIDKWRRKRSLEITSDNRPDLLAHAPLSKADKEYIAEYRETTGRRPKFSLALLHYPVRDKAGSTVVTSVTNMDLHDISRSCATYDVDSYYVVTPLAAQQEIAKRVISHWQEGYGASYNSNRKKAFNRTQVRSSVLEAIADIEKREGQKPIVMATTARPDRATISFTRAAHVARTRPILLLFGTGWGFTSEIFDLADEVLEPISGTGLFNHLSVRSAVSIILDRLHTVR